MKIWTCTTDGDDMPLETVVCQSFEEAAEPCRQSLREMEWEDRHGTPLDTAEQIDAAWQETFRGRCIISEHILLDSVQYYLIDVWGGVDPSLRGPYSSEDEQIAASVQKLDDGDPDDWDGPFFLDITNNVPTICA